LKFIEGGFDHQSPGSSIVPGAPISQSLGADGGTYLGKVFHVMVFLIFF